MGGEAVVVDASAIAAVLFGEEGGPKVAARLEGKVLFAPTLLRYEVASAGLKKCSEQPDQDAGLERALSLFPSLAIREIQVPPADLPNLARLTGLTTYDAAYLWLARALSSSLVSLDHRLTAAAAAEASS
jgi:predicted nucleic acid-binding protein